MNRNDLKSGKGLQVLCRSCHRKLHDGKGSEITSYAARIIPDPQTEASQAIAASHKNSDLMHVEFILCHSGTPNENRDQFTSEDLEDAAATAINKPLNWEHKDRNIGVIYESKFISIAKLTDTDKEYYKSVDPLENDFVVCRAAVWEYKYPSEAKSMRDREKEGKLFFSMENKFLNAVCSICNESFGSIFQYCDHLLSRRQTKNSSRIFSGSNFVGAAVTYNPADKNAGTLALANIEQNMEYNDFIFSKFLSDVSIADVVIPYIVNGGENMVIEKTEIPKDFIFDKFDDLPDESFADNINRVFPIDNIENVSESAKILLNDEMSFYKPTDKLIVLERLINAAKAYNVDIKELIGGNKEMSIDRNSPEFKAALAEVKNEWLKEMEDGSKMQEAEAKVAELSKEKTTIEAELAKAKEEKAKAEKVFEDYKKEIEAQEKANARWVILTEKGFAFDATANKLKVSLATMSDEQFTDYVAVLEEAIAKKLSAEELKKLEDEKKKKEETDKKAKATIDPVKESKEVAVATIVDGNDVKDTMFDSVVKNALGL